MPDNGQIGEKRGRPLGKKKKRPACHPSFRAPGPPTAEGWGFILGYASSSTVHWSLRDLAAIFNISVSTLQGGLARIPGGYTQNIEKRGRGADGDASRRQAVVDLMAMKPLGTLKEVAETLGVHPSTVGRDLEAEGWTARARGRQPWTGGDPVAWARTRLDFSRLWLGKLKAEGAKLRLLFCDECIFRVSDDRKIQWCMSGEDPTPREEHKWSATCHMWGCIGQGFRFIVNLDNTERSGPRGGVTSADYVAVLEENFLPCFKRHQQRYPSTKFLLIQDGCRIHTTDEALEAIRSWGMDVLDRKVWPPHSPDLNVIENLWGYAKHAVNKELSGDLSASVEAKRKLEREILKMWRSHPTADVNNLVASFPRRLKAVVDLKGEYTKY